MSGSMLMILGGKKPVRIPTNTAIPTISGTVQTGYVLTSTTGSWTPPVAGYYYQWQRGGSTGYSNITGASSSTYTVQTADQGYLLRCAVQASNSAGTSSQAFSSPTAVVPGQVVLSGYFGSTSWTAPPAVTSVSVVAVGMGGATPARTNAVTPGYGGGGGALSYSNGVSVTPGSTYTVNFQASSSRGGYYLTDFASGSVVAESGGFGYVTGGGSASNGTGTGKQSGGDGYSQSGAGGGAAGYAGSGGNGGSNNGGGSGGSGGGGGGAGGTTAYSSGTGSGGGGVGLLGTGADGAGGSGGTGYAARGLGGSGGGDATVQSYYSGGNGGAYGGGCGGGGAHYDYDPSPGYPGSGGAGAVRIMWGGGRSFPSNAGDL